MTLAAELFANDLTDSTLSAGITAGATSLTLTTGQGARFPAAVSGVTQFRVRIDDELMICTARSGDTLTVSRGAEGTTGATHATGAVVKQVVTADALERYANEYIWQPRHYGLLAWSNSPHPCANPAVTGTTSMWVSKVFVPETITASNVVTYVTTAGSGVTSAYMGVYDSSGALLGQTAQQSTAFNSTGTKSIALASPVTITGGPGVYVYVAFCCTAATTAPTLTRPSGTTFQNVNLSPADYVGGSTPGTNPLASSFTPSSLGNQPPFWMALS